MTYVLNQVFTEAEADDIFKYLLNKEIEYHKPYKRYNKMVKVPRGQSSYTINKDIHYNYGGVAGGSPVNEIMDERTLDITRKVNEAMGRNYNTILMNVYKNGADNIGMHQDKEAGWVEGTGFATIAFGKERNFFIGGEGDKRKDKDTAQEGTLHRDALRHEPPLPARAPALHDGRV